jgi:hypothetical protein
MTDEDRVSRGREVMSPLRGAQKVHFIVVGATQSMKTIKDKESRTLIQSMISGLHKIIR